MKRSQIAFIAIIVVVVAAIIAVRAGKASSALSVRSPAPSLGAAAPKVVVVAFEDFECPFSARSAGVEKEILAKYGSEVRFEFRHLPMSVHPNAVVAAQAAVAAQKHGKFWEFSAKLFENQKGLTKDAMIGWAVQVGIKDAAEFAADMESPEVKAIVARDVAIAGAVGVSGTPSFLVNGKLVPGAHNADGWKKILDGEIEKAQALLKTGTSQAELLKTMVTANAADRADKYISHLVKGEPAPERPVPAPTYGAGGQKAGAQPGAQGAAGNSGVASAQIYAAGAGGAAVQIGNPPAIKEDQSTVWKVAVRTDDPTKGRADAPVTIVAFEEFQCPFCAKSQDVLKQVQETYADKVRIVFKHNPLPFHENAEVASEAAEAARAQGKFWEMHDKLWAAATAGDPKETLVRAKLDEIAKAIGLDLKAYANAMDSHGPRGRIREDIDQAAATGARGTPNFFINGRKLVGAKSLDDFKRLIDEEIVKAKGLVDKGTPAAKVYETLIGEGKLLESLDGKAVKIDTTNAPSRGPEAAAIQIVLFEDFQCPFSSRLQDHIVAIEKEFAGRVRVQFMNFPLANIHKHAEIAAEAGMAVAAQDVKKFWALHDILFVPDNQKDLSREKIVEHAKKAGVDVARLNKDLDGGRYKEIVQKHQQAGTSLEVKGTPTVFINGHRFVPPSGYSADTFRSAIVRLLAAK